MPEIPLAANDIVGHLEELADELGPNGPNHILILVGGALLALRGLRDTTADVDSVRRLDQEIIEATARVAERHGLAPKWLNASAAAFLPATFDDRLCTLLLQRQRLTVLAAPMEQVFLMKLYAGRAHDYIDMVQIWPLTGFASPEHAAAAFADAYPHAPDDPHLANYIRQIADAAR